MSEGNIPHGWLIDHSHRQLARTLRQIHADLARPWTLEQLARDAAMSRSSFAVLFRSVVGVPPLTYICTWRIYRAKLVLAAGNSIAAAAAQTGYGSDIALSRAFDIDPGRYGAVPKGPMKLKEERTTFEAAILKAALEADLPILGICNGMQLLAVTLGGALIQHIPTEVPGA